ncbi:unnamed protein product [Lasius platythorax]|uniref:Uncharacterized protein n=1 Tax=Lasius platythorax TaxID=488582 RepID=A0AAV2NLD4_9HYME
MFPSITSSMQLNDSVRLLVPIRSSCSVPLQNVNSMHAIPPQGPTVSPDSSPPVLASSTLKGHPHPPRRIYTHTWSAASPRIRTSGVETRLESGDNRRVEKLSWH